MHSSESYTVVRSAKLLFAKALLLGSWLSACSASAPTDAAQENVAAAPDSIMAATAAQADYINRSDAELDSKPIGTDFSGHGPDDRSIIKAYTNNQALYGITWAESSDDPCYFEAKYRNVATGSAGTTLSMNLCDGHDRGDYESVTLPTDYFATGVRVCLNSGRDKVKGIQLIGQHVMCLLGADGQYVSTGGCTSWGGGLFSNEYQLCSDPGTTFRSCADLEQRPWNERYNCKGDQDGPDGDWEVEVRCDGTNKVATGLKFGTTPGSNGRSMVEGIALECHILEH